jgi:hypothetical protein
MARINEAVYGVEHQGETAVFSVNLLVHFSLNYQNKIVIFNRIKHVFF